MILTAFLLSSLPHARPQEAVVPSELAAPAAANTWPAFRGAEAGWTTARDLPIEWDAFAWSAPIPGVGQSSPVVARGHVFVTSIDGPMKERCIVTCYALADGTQRWSHAFDACHEVELTDLVSKAAPTPVVDQDRVVALFESGDLVAFDHEGERLWSLDLFKRYGPFTGNHGLGASLALSGPNAIALLDHGGPSHLLAVDRATGEVRWSIERGPHVSYTSPFVHDGVIVVSSAGHVDGYDASSGARLWRVEGIDDNIVPSPSLRGGRVIAARSKGGGALAIDVPAAPGESAKIAWTGRGLPPSGYASPLLRDRDVLLVNTAGVLTSVDAATGKRQWKERLGTGEVWASPIARGDLVWYFGKQGTSVVIRPAKDTCDIVATSSLKTEGGVFGVAAVDGTFLVREPSRLIALRVRKSEPAERD